MSLYNSYFCPATLSSFAADFFRFNKWEDNSIHLSGSIGQFFMLVVEVTDAFQKELKNSTNSTDTGNQRGKVLVLPTLNSFALFLCSEVLTADESLTFFVVGSELTKKRLVICNKDLIAKNIKQWSDSTSTKEVSNPNGTSSVTKTSNNGYIGPSTSSTQTTTATCNKQRRPDRKLYVPKHKRPDNGSCLEQTVEPKLSKCEGDNKVSQPCGDIQMQYASLAEYIMQKADHDSQKEQLSLDRLNCSQPEADEHWVPLDIEQLNELVSIVGPVDILRPTWEDLGFDLQISMDESLYSHLVEVYDFSPSFRDSDIEKILEDFKEKGYKIVWVDDTHAILVFRSFVDASEALTFMHSELKLRPVIIASTNSKLKILNESGNFAPYKERPKTDPSVAQRLISTSLGIRCDHEGPDTAEMETEEAK